MGAVVVILALSRQLLRDGTYWLSLPASRADKQNAGFFWRWSSTRTTWTRRITGATGSSTAAIMSALIMSICTSPKTGRSLSERAAALQR